MIPRGGFHLISHSILLLTCDTVQLAFCITKEANPRPYKEGMSYALSPPLPLSIPEGGVGRVGRRRSAVGALIEAWRKSRKHIMNGVYREEEGDSKSARA